MTLKTDGQPILRPSGKDPAPSSNTLQRWNVYWVRKAEYMKTLYSRDVVIITSMSNTGLSVKTRSRSHLLHCYAQFLKRDGEFATGAEYFSPEPPCDVQQLLAKQRRIFVCRQVFLPFFERTCPQPRIDFAAHGNDRAPASAAGPAHWQVQIRLPALYGTHTTIKICGNFFPRVQNFV